MSVGISIICLVPCWHREVNFPPPGPTLTENHPKMLDAIMPRSPFRVDYFINQLPQKLLSFKLGCSVSNDACH